MEPHDFGIPEVDVLEAESGVRREMQKRKTEQESHAPVHIGGSIVLVDRNDAYRHLMMLRLRHAGLDCHGAGDTRCAHLLLSELPAVAVVILDRESACGDGGELVRMIREKFPGAVFLGTSTAHCRSDFAAPEIGISHFLQKPWSEADLLQILRP